MNTSTVLRQPLTQREAAHYFFFAALGLAVFAFVLITVWALTPTPKLTHIGELTSYPSANTPYLIQIGGQQVYLFHDGQNWLVLDPNLRLNGAALNCAVQWKPELGYFEDPCWGGKYNTRGEWLSGPRRQLGYYSIEVRGTELWADTSRLHFSEPSP